MGKKLEDVEKNLTYLEKKKLEQIRYIESVKISKLKRKVRKALKIPIVGKNKRQKAILKDIGLMYEDLLDVLLKDEFKGEKQYLASIDNFLDLETKAYSYPYKLKYKVGDMHKLIASILLQHDLMDLGKQ